MLCRLERDVQELAIVMVWLLDTWSVILWAEYRYVLVMAKLTVSQLDRGWAAQWDV